jgi:hypothetical protein
MEHRHQHRPDTRVACGRTQANSTLEEVHEAASGQPGVSIALVRRAVGYLWVMGVGGRRSEITWEVLAGTEEGGLRFPGSVLVDEEHHDEGDGWGFDAIQLDAMINRGWYADATAEEVTAWFDEQLIARGWSRTGTAAFQPGRLLGASFYLRGTSSFTLRVFGRPEDRPPWAYWSDGWSDPRLRFDFTSTAGPADGRATDADSNT